MVLEVMGRHAGWVALYAGIAGGADWILIPEVALDLDEMCDHLKALKDRGKTYGIVVTRTDHGYSETNNCQLYVTEGTGNWSGQWHEWDSSKALDTTRGDYLSYDLNGF